MAAHEGHARARLVPLQGGDEDDAHLGGGARVSAAAGLAVEAFGLDDPHVGKGPLGRPKALGAGLGRGERRHSHRARLPDDLVRPPLGRASLVDGHGPFEVDGGDLAPEVEGDRLRARRLDEGPREKVLPVVLLHVVAAPRGVHHAAHPLLGQRPVEHVEDVRPVLEHGHHARLAEHARVPGLAAALRVERGAVEDDGGSSLALAPACHQGVELEERGIGGVESLGHRTVHSGTPPGGRRATRLRQTGTTATSGPSPRLR